ncbi:MAG: ATP-grasp domain-containing protein [Oscillospiraceae bacterium]|nr:ATP-grasp domain-containing protein [Oscillospiraceae bacterium]
MFAMTVDELYSVPYGDTVLLGQTDPDKYSCKLNDTIYDGYKNSFNISGFEMPCRLDCDDTDSNNSAEIMISPDNQINNNYIDRLLTSEYNTAFLFCCDPLSYRQPDFDYEAEYNCCNDKYLFSFDGFVGGEQVALPEVREIVCRLIYRGWMMKPTQYERLYKSLYKRGCPLVNTPTQYNYCHMLPDWYNDLGDITPKSVWTNELTDTAIISLLGEFSNSPVVIKDFVKSRKHEWYEACYIPCAQDTDHALDVIHTFLDRQGSDLVGGLVIREYVSLASIGFHPKSGMPVSQEYRAFFLYGKLVCLINYWDGTPAEDEELVHFLTAASERIKSNFFSVDAAKTADGKYIVMEIGDGQVSGLQDYSEKKFYDSIFKII